MHAKPGADTGGAACRTMIYILICVSVRDSAWGAGRSGVGGGNWSQRAAFHMNGGGGGGGGRGPSLC